MWTTPEKHTKKRETPGNANQNKTTRRAGTWVEEVDELPQAFQIKGAL